MTYRKAKSMAGFIAFTALLQVFAVLLFLALVSPEASVPFSSYARQSVSP